MSDRAAGIPIVKEGLPFVAAAGTPAVAAGVLGWTGLATAFGAVALFTAWFFRNPKRSAPTSERAVVAPGDGKIVEICEEPEPRFLKSQSVRISIFLNIFDVHVNRIPCQGTVEQVAYQPGRFLVASRPEATLQNEQNALLIRAAQGTKVLCVQIAGLIARRIVCWVKPGEMVACGERFGLIRFGSRMDVFLPVGTKLSVKVGDHVKGGETLLGELTCVERS
jgi:phosphatidylserine decarboxylase